MKYNMFIALMAMGVVLLLGASYSYTNLAAAESQAELDAANVAGHFAIGDWLLRGSMAWGVLTAIVFAFRPKKRALTGPDATDPPN